MGNYYVRKAVLGDEHEIAKIHINSWLKAFSDIVPKKYLLKITDFNFVKNLYNNILKKDLGNGFILYIDNKPHCISFWSSARDNDIFPDFAEIVCIHSMPDNWRKGYGKIMLQHIIKEIKLSGYRNIMLWVFEENISARYFYKNLGFKETDKRKEVFEKHSIAYIMSINE